MIIEVFGGMLAKRAGGARAIQHCALPKNWLNRRNDLRYIASPL